LTKTPRTTLVTFLLDRSGSMGLIRDDTIGAFNTYLDGLKKDPGIRFSFLQFDSVSIDTLQKNIPIEQAPPLNHETFEPRGTTPLIDACVKTVRAVEDALKRHDHKPKVVVCFQTDGQENASREHSWEELTDLVKEKIAEGWQFNFMGASIDAYSQASQMGLSAAQTMSYDSRSREASRASFEASAANTVAFARGISASTSYSIDQKRASGDRFDPGLKMAKKVESKKAIVDDVQL
jgi:hypothetical protein